MDNEIQEIASDMEDSHSNLAASVGLIRLLIVIFLSFFSELQCSKYSICEKKTEKIIYFLHRQTFCWNCQ